jgi:alpha-D-xyloside xylohydrolase
MIAQSSTPEENMLSMFPRLRVAWFAIIALTGYSGQAISQPSAHVTSQISITGSDPVASYVKSPNSVVFQLRTGVLRLQIWSDEIIRATLSPTSTISDQVLPVIIGKQPKAVPYQITESAGSLSISTGKVTVVVNKGSGALQFLDSKRTVLLQELGTGGRSMTPNSSLGANVYTGEDCFAYSSDECIYGLGQHQQGIWNYSGNIVTLAQVNKEIGLPVLVSSKGYGVLWNNASVTNIDVGSSNPSMLSWTSNWVESMDYFFMYGPSVDGVIRDYRLLTGTAPMFADWFYGLWNSKNRYQSQQELENALTQYRTNNIPVDGIVQDWFWWGNNPWDSFIWDAPWPDPAGMFSFVHQNNGHVLLSTWAEFQPVGNNGNTNLNFNALQEQNALILPITSFWAGGQTAFYDPFTSSGRNAFWSLLRKQLYPLGVDAWWLDADEPEFVGPNANDWPSETTSLGSASRVYNGFPLMHTTSVYQGWRSATDTRRVMILSRSAFAGQQRNAAVCWSGDINSDWPTFAAQVPAGLNFSISGIPYWNTDIGGYEDTGVSLTDAGYQELFTRWFQYGVFCPMTRIHGQTPGKEIWAWPQPTQQILVNYDNLRYRLFPYIYSQAWQITSASGTLMRPLIMDFPSDQRALQTGNEFMFGPAILVAPVTQSLAAPMVPLPDNVLKDTNGVAGQLTATYYNGENFQTQVLQRADTIFTISNNGTPGGGPVQGLGTLTNGSNIGGYSVTWKGSITTGAGGTYTFSTTSDDGSRVIVNGVTVVSNWAPQPATTVSGTIKLAANTTYPFEIDYFADQPDGTKTLGVSWGEPSAVSLTWPVYLPAGTTWTDFWTGQRYPGGQTVIAAAPIETIPLFVRAGSIVPMGPFGQYIAQTVRDMKDPIEIRVYPGADGTFTLYQDEGDNYNYEKGEYATTEFIYSDKKKQLVIRPRKGSFPGMITQKFAIILVKPGQGLGVGTPPAASSSNNVIAGTVVNYDGGEITVPLGN